MAGHGAILFVGVLFWAVPVAAVTWHAHSVGRTKLWGVLTFVAPLVGVLLYLILGREGVAL